jgi:hypothetical protein
VDEAMHTLRPRLAGAGLEVTGAATDRRLPASASAALFDGPVGSRPNSGCRR